MDGGELSELSCGSQRQGAPPVHDGQTGMLRRRELAEAGFRGTRALSCAGSPTPTSVAPRIASEYSVPPLPLACHCKTPDSHNSHKRRSHRVVRLPPIEIPP